MACISMLSYYYFQSPTPDLEDRSSLPAELNRKEPNNLQVCTINLAQIDNPDFLTYDSTTYGRRASASFERQHPPWSKGPAGRCVGAAQARPAPDRQGAR